MQQSNELVYRRSNELIQGLDGGLINVATSVCCPLRRLRRKLSLAKGKSISSYLGILYPIPEIPNPNLNLKLCSREILPLAPWNFFLLAPTWILLGIGESRQSNELIQGLDGGFKNVATSVCCPLRRIRRKLSLAKEKSISSYLGILYPIPEIPNPNLNLKLCSRKILL